MSLPGKFLKTEAAKYTLIGVIFGLFFPVIATIIRIGDANLPYKLSSAIAVQTTDSLLWIIDTAPIFLGIFASIAGRRQEKAMALYEQLRQRENELIQDRANLEQRVEERTAILAKKTEQLRAASYVARQTSNAQDLGSLLNNIVNLITTQFGYYHTGLFFINEADDEAILHAASSEGGKRMVARGHSLKVGTQGIVGHAAAQKKPRIALDVGTDAVFFNNPDLPMTRSEMALPLMIRNKVIGVLDIQSDQPQAFNQDDVEVFQTLADQAAIAIENARLLEESQAAIRQLEATTALRTQEAWSQKVEHGRYTFTYTPLGLRAGKPSMDDENTLKVPILLRGQKIGLISLARKDDTNWGEIDKNLINEVANQTGLAVDNIRLLEEATQRVKQEQTVGELAARFGQSIDIDNLLQTAARELGQIPDVAEVSVFVGQIPEQMPAKRRKNQRQ